MEVRPTHSETPRTRAAKIASFDVVRTAAAFGVVLLHCCVPYMQPAVPGLAWPVRDTPHWLAEQCFWTIELFIMPLFLVLAGFLAWQTLNRRGATYLIQNRAKRLLIPLLFGIIVVLPLDLYSWLLGWVAEGLIPLQKLRSLKFDANIDRDLWGLSHLWFLQYLFLYVLVLGSSVWALHRFPSRSRITSNPRFAASLLLFVGCLTLYFRPDVVWGFQHSFFPVPSKWIYSGVFFALGALLAVHDHQLDWLKVNAGRFVTPSIVFAVAALTLGGWHLRGGSNHLATATLAIATCMSAAMITLSMIGMAAKHVQSVPVSISYLAAASFWVYIVHHPVLGLVHTDLKWLLPTTSSILKVGLAFALVSALSLATYELWVRKTALGRLLGFQWQSPSRSNDMAPANAKDDIISIDNRRDSSRVPTPAPTRRAA